ncbi:hypothetical protein [Arthrobacter sp. efr-133-TYG-118]|nr:hypothetical protein [Arthrobacter sp. efr-133-TYG-118]
MGLTSGDTIDLMESLPTHHQRKSALRAVGLSAGNQIWRQHEPEIQ